MALSKVIQAHWSLGAIEGAVETLHAQVLKGSESCTRLSKIRDLLAGLEDSLEEDLA